MTDTYQALDECARRRIGREWDCTDAEREILTLITDLSYALGQSWAVVPCLNDFAEACGVHKSTVSRALKSALSKGFLQILQRQNETLYAVCTAQSGDKSEDDQQRRTLARDRLKKLNQVRDQGAADVDGQQRIPGVFPSEETAAPAAAFEAILETESDQETPVIEDTEHRLEKLLRTMRRTQGEPEIAPTTTSQRRPEKRGVEKRGPEIGSFEAQWLEASKGLSGDPLYALELIRNECMAVGGEQPSAFYQFRFAWRKRVQQHPRKYLEAAGVCKALRLEGNQSISQPGAFIYRSVQEMIAPRSTS